MNVQQDIIDKMTIDTKKALGNHVEALMVDTFKKEAFWKKIESWFMMLCSLTSLALIGYLGYEWLNHYKVVQIQNLKDVVPVKNSKDAVTFAQAGLDWIELVFLSLIHI